MEYGPTTTRGKNFVDFGRFGNFDEDVVEYSWFYDSPDVDVIEHSDFAEKRAEWTYNYRFGSGSAKFLYQSQPGIKVRGPQGFSPRISRIVKLTFNTPGLHLKPEVPTAVGNWLLDFDNYGS